MKRKLIYHIKGFAFLACMIFAMMSCQQDFLEKPAASDVTLDTVFANSTNAQQQITSLYHDRFFSSNNIAKNWWDDAYWGWSEMGEDIFFPQSPWTRHWDYVEGTMSTTSRQMYPLDRLFFAVRAANTFIEKADEIPTVSDADQQYVDQMLGEAHAHLAYQYFKGMRIWGSLPWINVRLQGGEEPIARMPYGELVDSVVHRLDIAANLLPARWEDRYTGRFTSVAAKALKAKVLVYAASDLYNGSTPSYAAGYEHPELLGYGNYDKERWKRAADACKEAIDAAHAANHALYTGSGEEQNIYHLALNLTDEHILYERFLPYNTIGGWVHCHNQMNYPYNVGWYSRIEVGYQPSFQHVDGYQMRNGVFPISGYQGGDGTKPIITQAGIDAGYTDQDFAKNRDPRFHENIIYHGSTFGESYNDKLINFDIDKSVADRTHGDWPNFLAGFITRKFINEDLGESASITHPQIHAILRLADIYLLYAEALNRYNGSPNADALEFFNAVRSRSGMPDYNAANYEGGSPEEKFQNAIKYERRVEFYLEAQRYFDLRRWKDGEDLVMTYTGCTVNNGVVSRTNLGAGYTWQDKLYFLPFSNDDVNNTPGLYQNPGY